MARGTTTRFALTIPSVVLPPLRRFAPLTSSASAHLALAASSVSPEPAASTPTTQSSAPEPRVLVPTAHDVTAGQPRAARPAARCISRSGTAHGPAAPRVSLPG